MEDKISNDRVKQFEIIFKKIAEKNMVEFDLSQFKLTHQKLYNSIMESMYYISVNSKLP